MALLDSVVRVLLLFSDLVNRAYPQKLHDIVCVHGHLNGCRVPALVLVALLYVVLWPHRGQLPYWTVQQMRL